MSNETNQISQVEKSRKGGKFNHILQVLEEAFYCNPASLLLRKLKEHPHSCFGPEISDGEDSEAYKPDHQLYAEPLAESLLFGKSSEIPTLENSRFIINTNPEKGGIDLDALEPGLKDFVEKMLAQGAGKTQDGGRIDHRLTEITTHLKAPGGEKFAILFSEEEAALGRFIRDAYDMIHGIFVHQKDFVASVNKFKNDPKLKRSSWLSKNGHITFYLMHKEIEASLISISIDRNGNKEMKDLRASRSGADLSLEVNLANFFEKLMTTELDKEEIERQHELNRQSASDLSYTAYKFGSEKS